MDLLIAKLTLAVTMVILTVYQALTSDNDVTKVNTFIEATLGCRKIPGLIVSVVKDGRVVLTNGYGVKDIETREPVTDDTLFQIASLTKAFTATAAMDLLQSSKFSSTSKMKDVFPNFVINSSELRTQYATVEDLLSHRLGIPDNNKIRLDPNLTRADVLRRIKYFKNRGEFRDSFYYSNLFYGIITHLIETLGDAKYETIVKEKLFKPLGMDSSTFATIADYSALDVSTAYLQYGGKFEVVSPEFSRHWATLIGSGGILSNAKDMARWLLFHLQGGKNINGTTVVNKDVLDKTYKHHLAITSSSNEKYFTKPKVPVSTTASSYAMGWKRGYYRGYRMLTHTGSTYGYVALITLLPDKNIGIFTSMTGADSNYLYRTMLHNYIADIYLGETPWLNATRACAFPNEPAGESTRGKRHTKPFRRAVITRRLSDYVGTYSNYGYGNMHVFINTTTSRLGLKYGIALYDLKPLGGDNFYGDAYGLAYFIKIDEFQFRMSHPSDGQIKTITVPKFEKNFPPVFSRVSNENPIGQIVG